MDEVNELVTENLFLRHKITSLENYIANLMSKIEHQNVIMAQLQSAALLTMHDIGNNHSQSSESSGGVNCNGVYTSSKSNSKSNSKSVNIDTTMTPLISAIEAGDIDEFDKLVLVQRNKSSTDIIADNGVQFILMASQMGKIEMVKHLLDLGVDVHAEFDSPLQWAARKGDIELAKCLIMRGANPKALNKCSIRLAKNMGHLEVAHFLEEQCNLGCDGNV